MSPRKWLQAACAALALATTGCDYWYNTVPSPDVLWEHIPWFDQMIVAPSVNPYSRVDVPRYTPKGAVPVSGGEADWSTGNPLTLQYGFDTLVAKALVNPTTPGATVAAARPAADIPRLPATLEARGDTLYHTYCAVCHGTNGDPMTATVGPKMGAPSLLTARARGYADGYLYGMIRYGRGVMPQYGDKIPVPTDRWAVVNHVRKLQAAAPPEATAGGAH